MAISSILLGAQATALDHPIRFLLAFPIVAFFLYVVVNEFIRKEARIAGLDGPGGLPLIGNLHQIRT
jgi:3-hydroxyphenylacetate 6-hydroxylase